MWRPLDKPPFAGSCPWIWTKFSIFRCILQAKNFSIISVSCIVHKFFYRNVRNSITSTSEKLRCSRRCLAGLHFWVRQYMPIVPIQWSGYSYLMVNLPVAHEPWYHEGQLTFAKNCQHSAGHKQIIQLKNIWPSSNAKWDIRLLPRLQWDLKFSRTSLPCN